MNIVIKNEEFDKQFITFFLKICKEYYPPFDFKDFMKTRKGVYSMMRQVGFYWLRRNTTYSYLQVAKLMYRKDHTTALYGEGIALDSIQLKQGGYDLFYEFLVKRMKELGIDNSCFYCEAVLTREMLCDILFKRKIVRFLQRKHRHTLKVGKRCKDYQLHEFKRPKQEFKPLWTKIYNHAPLR